MSSKYFKSNHLRGDFVFRDVYKRRTFSTFAGNEYSEDSTVYIDQQENALDCTAQVTTYADGVGSLLVYTRNGEAFDKGNAAQATVSVNSLATTFRSSNTNVNGGFTVRGSLLKVSGSTARVGINEPNPGYTLDVNGDVNVRGNLWVNGNALSSSSSSSSAEGGQSVSFTTSSRRFGTTTAFVYGGPGEEGLDGVPFFGLQQSTGDAFVSSGGVNGNVFTFTQAGTFLVQVEVEGGYPWALEGDLDTYFLKNGDPSVRIGVERQSQDGGNYACTRSVVVFASATDTLRFILDTSKEMGVDKASISFVNLTSMGSATLPESNVAMSNVTANVVSATTMAATSLDVSGNVSAGNLAVSGTLSVGGSQWASSVVYGTNVAFPYQGAGVSGMNGVPFFAQTLSNGTPFVTAGGSDNSVFTFSTAGTYMLQAEVETGYPFFPEGDVTSYFLKNADVSLKWGAESHLPLTFSTTRPYLMTVGANDNVRFVLESSSRDDYEAGIASCRLTMLKLA